MTASPGAIAARREIWASLAGLLRAYLAAVSLGGEPIPAMVVQVSDTEIHLEGVHRTIKLSMQLRTGDGYWAFYRAAAEGEDSGDTMLEEGAFRLSLDSTFVWSGKRGKLEMDAVAEALVTMILS